MFESQIERVAPGHGNGDEHGACHAQVIHQPPNVLPMAETAGDHLRLAEAAQVGGDDAVRARELADLVFPHAAVADAGMEQEQRRAVAGAAIEELGAVDGGPARFDRRGRHGFFTQSANDMCLSLSESAR
jgi:hypothetical protein